MYEFNDTYNRFKSAVDAVAENSYDTFVGWVLLNKEYRAPALYVTFYPEILMAWRKNYSMFPYIDEAIAISTVMQYLMKNVMVIIDNPKRFSEPYIYKVAYRCIYSLGKVKSNANYYHNCTHSFYEFDETQTNLNSGNDHDANSACFRIHDSAIDDTDILDLIKNREIEQLVDEIVAEDTRFGYIIDNLLCHTRIPKDIADSKQILFDLLKSKLFQFKER